MIHIKNQEKKGWHNPWIVKNLNEGFKESDVKLFSDLLSIYSKLDKWWINEIEIPISGEDVPEDYDRESVCGGQAVELSIINSIILANKGNEYKDLLKTISEMNNPKLNEEGKCCEEGKSLWRRRKHLKVTEEISVLL